MGKTEIVYTYDPILKDSYYQEEMCGGIGVWCKSENAVGFKIKKDGKLYGRVRKQEDIDSDRLWIKSVAKEI